MSRRRASEELERDLVFRRSEEGSAPRVVAREFTGARVDPLSPVQPDLFEDFPVQLLNLVSEGARAGVEDGVGGWRGDVFSTEASVS